MSARSIPALLSPYISLPPETSLILLTGVLGASTNWLVLRFLHSALSPQKESPSLNFPEQETTRGAGEVEIDKKVLLVSFMRDLTFWKEGARKLGLDLDKLAAKNKFGFLDGLNGLFGHAPLKNNAGKQGEESIGSSEVKKVYNNVLGKIREIRREGGADSKVLLVIDQLDLLLAAGNGVGAVELGEMLMDLRSADEGGIDATVVSLSADIPLVMAQTTPLEKNHAAFLLSVAHQADFIMSLRLLDTGTAKDVSGVLRVTVADEVEDVMARNLEERELLYFVGGDGGVRVFERGQ